MCSTCATPFILLLLSFTYPFWVGKGNQGRRQIRDWKGALVGSGITRGPARLKAFLPEGTVGARRQVGRARPE